MSHIVKRSIDVAEAMATWPLRTARQVLKDSKVYEETAIGNSVGEGLSLAEEMAALPFRMAREMLVGNSESTYETQPPGGMPPSGGMQASGGANPPDGGRLAKIEERLDFLENRVMGAKEES